MTTNEYSHGALKEFNRDLKKLRKYKHLKKDLNTFIDLVKGLWPRLPIGTVPISNLGQSVTLPIYKVREFYSKDIGKGKRSGFRIIFTFVEDENAIILIEIYHKSGKTNEDRKRILKYFSS